MTPSEANSFATLDQVIKQRGHLILYGVRSGGDLAAPLWDLRVKSIQFHMYALFNFTGSLSLGLTRNDGAMERAIAFINGGIEKGLFKPKVDRTFKLDDVSPRIATWKRAPRSARS
jgi:NADPH:quinone reductase-like Zn-dependent oxidoreductase